MKNKLVKALLLAVAGTGVAYFVNKFVEEISSTLDEDDEEETDDRQETIFENYRFEGYEIDDDDAAKVADMFTNLGVLEEVCVMRSNFSEEGEDNVRDYILDKGVSIDYSRPVYGCTPDYTYIVWFDTSGVIHGLCIDFNGNPTEISTLG